MAVSGVAPLVGVQRTVQKNGNVKSEPKYLAHEESTCFHDRGDGILISANRIQSDNRTFRSRPLVGRKVRHSTGERLICRKNHKAGHCLGKFSLLGNVRHLRVP